MTLTESTRPVEPQRKDGREEEGGGGLVKDGKTACSGVDKYQWCGEVCVWGGFEKGMEVQGHLMALFLRSMSLSESLHLLSDSPFSPARVACVHHTMATPLTLNTVHTLSQALLIEQQFYRPTT